MSLKPKSTNKFKKDVEICKSRNLSMVKIHDIMQLLIDEKPLPASCQDHALRGNFAGRRDCHIEPNWILIYNKNTPGEIIFERTGTHSDLFR
ncbi:MAG: type II toxin-antitoxin system YafQ family toxin [Lachnospiraceae bacterium]|jgi:mRNA interferase YafQ|nr:type II toxin-antitoxin system YafQ family toxin [Lachnospiraceae bacterium]